MFASLLIRWIVALILVFATYNPTDMSYVRWALENYSSNLSMVVLLGLILLIAYTIFLRATLQSIGVIGIAMIVALIAVIIWVLYDNGLLDPANSTLMTWIGLVGLSLVLGIGLSWSIVRRQISGQIDTRHDDDDEIDA